MACSYCYNSGHNRRSCPSYTEALKRSAENGSSYAESMLRKRGPGSGHSKKKKDKKCSFCDHKGHDRRTCDVLNEYLEKTSEDTIAVRNEIYDRCQEHGFGPGALVSFKQQAWDEDESLWKDVDRLGLVTEIRWSALEDSSWNTSTNCVTVQWQELEHKPGPRVAHKPFPLEIISKHVDENNNPQTRVSRFPGNVDRFPVLVSPAVGPGSKCGNFTLSKTLKDVKRLTKERSLTYWSYKVESKLGEDRIRELYNNQYKREMGT